MNRYRILWMPLLLMLLLLQGCKKEEIVFPIEEPQFEVRDGYILIEVIAPNETSVNKDTLYIAGAFSGDERLQLTPAPYMDYKYGIYLDPKEFKDGKTLADGYYFGTLLQGKEVSGKDQPITHDNSAAAGERIDLTLQHWEMFYNDHNGYTLYVENNTSWKELYLYAWAEGEAEIFGGWPGMPPTGTEEIDGVTYSYFDMQMDNTGKTYNLILNGGSGQPQLPDYSGFTIERDLYLTITDDGWKEVGKQPGYRVFALNHTGWIDLKLYVWGDREAMGGWPGKGPLKTTTTINDNEYLIFEFNPEDTGKQFHLLFNSGNDDKTDPEDVIITLNKDYYIQVRLNNPQIIDPEGEIEKPTDLPEGDMIIRAKKPAGWDNLFIYAGGIYTNPWPGSLMEEDGDGWYSFALRKGISFTFASAAIGNKSETIKGVFTDTCYEITNEGSTTQVSCE